MLYAVVLIVCPLLFAIGAMTDLVSYRIPNWVSLALAGAFAMAGLLSGMSAATAGLHVLAGLGALAATIALFAFKIVGGGDAKLFSAGALWAGPAFFAPFCLWVALTGGAFAMLIIVLRRMPLPAFSSRVPLLNQLLLPSAGMPYGVAIGLGALIVLPETPLFLQVMA